MNTLPHPTSARRRGAAAAGLAATSLALALGGCAGLPAPTEQMAVARAAVDRADGLAASEAPQEVAAARDKIARAQAAMAARDHAQARQLAEQAEADAALAEARARSARADRALAEVRESLRQLRAELARP